MPDILNEKMVMQYYLEQLDEGKVDFLANRLEMAAGVRESIVELINAQKMNEKIHSAVELWKRLFEASMSFIDNNRQGYDTLFAFFDTYVEFEELIFASDSFYRDHTLHCLWVYFLGEYIARQEEFDELFTESRQMYKIISQMDEILSEMNALEGPGGRNVWRAEEIANGFTRTEAATRCVAALTHDLGYPIKKIEKINKSMKTVLPYFSLHSFNDFKFEYDGVQQKFIQTFLDILSSETSINLNIKGELAYKLFDVDGKGIVTGIKRENVKSLTEEERERFREQAKCEISFDKKYSLMLAYSDDFEQYKHGIMSAFLLVKNVQAFKNMNYLMDKPMGSQSFDISDFLVKLQILQAVTDHTCDAIKISKLDNNSYLTIIDELEEFSRISRASQSREYVQEFCSTSVYMDDGWLCVDFIFDNADLENISPEKAFRGRCKRMLTLFDVRDMSEALKLRIRCISKLPNDNRTYSLRIARKIADVTIDGVEQDIPTYLKSRQFNSAREYAE